MNTRRESGFALVITVVLLALLVLVVYCLSALSRVGTDLSVSGGYQLQARQHALLGLSQAIGNLQRYTAEDDVITGMAGAAGVPEGTAQAARHWCGVWDRNARFFRWLASGADGPTPPALAGADALEIVGAGSLGADGPDREHVRVLLQPVTVATRDGTTVDLGRYAWWVGDEGVKLSAVLPAERHAIDELVPIQPTAPALAQVLTYEQLSLVPSTVTPTALAGQLRGSFHALGRMHLSPTITQPVPGLLNVNSTSVRYWRGIAATYNRLKPGAAPSIAAAGFAVWMRDHFPPADPGAAKAANGPYPSVDLFLNSDALIGALRQSGGSVRSFGDVMRPWLTTHTDTFRVRAYGESFNPAAPGRVESTAWCEAIVQRVKDDPASLRGRFVVIAFRWLGPDDI